MRTLVRSKLAAEHRVALLSMAAENGCRDHDTSKIIPLGDPQGVAIRFYRALYEEALAVSSVFFGWELPKIYRQRKCAGVQWRSQFPMTREEEIRRFLSVFAQASGALVQHILVYSDSLSWGIIFTTRQRLPFDQRWPGVMEHALCSPPARRSASSRTASMVAALSGMIHSNPAETALLVWLSDWQ